MCSVAINAGADKKGGYVWWVLFTQFSAAAVQSSADREKEILFDVEAAADRSCDAVAAVGEASATVGPTPLTGGRPLYEDSDAAGASAAVVAVAVRYASSCWSSSIFSGSGPLPALCQSKAEQQPDAALEHRSSDGSRTPSDETHLHAAICLSRSIEDTGASFSRLAPAAAAPFFLLLGPALAFALAPLPELGRRCSFLPAPAALLLLLLLLPGLFTFGLLILTVTDTGRNSKKNE